MPDPFFMMDLRKNRLTKILAMFMTGAFFWIATSASASEFKLSLPIDCRLGVNCFLQQLPDMDPSKGVLDPFCNKASYDGHKGTDIRLVTLKEVSQNISVLASAPGIVKAFRDGEKDSLVSSNADRNAIKNKECGNGIIISHANGFETQYCHLKRGSISVTNGQIVKTGDVIGSVGASGLTQFPHVHITVRHNGKVLDPFTGSELSQGCEKDPSKQNPLWKKAVLSDLMIETTQIIAAGFAGNPIKHSELVNELPAEPTSDSPATVGWAYFINLQKGDQAKIRIHDPQGALYAESTTKPLDRSKASYSIFSGRKRSPAKGIYRLESFVLRGNETIAAKSAEFEVK